MSIVSTYSTKVGFQIGSHRLGEITTAQLISQVQISVSMLALYNPHEARKHINRVDEYIKSNVKFDNFET